MFAPALVRADGEYYSFDFSDSTASAVVSATRGPLTFGADYTDYGDGITAGFSVTRQLPFDFGLEGLGLSLGPSVRFNQGEEPLFGVAATAQRYVPTDFGNYFFQLSVNSINLSYFSQAQIGFADSGLTLSISRGASTEYEETSVTVSKRLGQSPFHLRAGYRFGAEEWFAGLEINTF